MHPATTHMTTSFTVAPEASFEEAIGKGNDKATPRKRRRETDTKQSVRDGVPVQDTPMDKQGNKTGKLIFYVFHKNYFQYVSCEFNQIGGNLFNRNIRNPLTVLLERALSQIRV